MRNQQECFTGFAEIVHLLDAAFLKFDIADGEHLVDEKDIGIDLNGDGEAEADIHTGRVEADRLVDIVTDAGKFDDFVEALLHDGAWDIHDRAVEEDIFASCEIRVKAGAQFEEGRNFTGSFDVTGRWGHGTSDGREEG